VFFEKILFHPAAGRHVGGDKPQNSVAARAALRKANMMKYTWRKSEAPRGTCLGGVRRGEQSRKPRGILAKANNGIKK